jgi:hypothetical protein
MEEQVQRHATAHQLPRGDERLEGKATHAVHVRLLTVNGGCMEVIKTHNYYAAVWVLTSTRSVVMSDETWQLMPL